MWPLHLGQNVGVVGTNSSTCTINGSDCNTGVLASMCAWRAKQCTVLVERQRIDPD